MHSNPLASASAMVLCLATTASAQQQIQAVRVLGPVRDAGIYHVATGTWTRNSGPQANLGPDIIYRNDVVSSYFGTGWESAQGVDEGILPGPGNPFSGPQNAYLINGLSFSYCALGAGPGITWDLELYDSYVACDDPDFPGGCINSVWTWSLGTLPRSSACWLVTLDLSGGAEACVEADGGFCAPGYDGAGGLDGYGFGQTWLNGGLTAGPVLAGDPNWSPRGDGTCYQPNMTCPAGATGLGEQDLLGIGTNPLGGAGNGCFWFNYNNLNGCGGPNSSPSLSVDHTLFADCTIDCHIDYCDIIICDEATDPNNVADATVNHDCNGSDGSLILHLSKATPFKATYALISTGNGVISNPPGATGALCVAGSIGRYAQDISVISGAGTTQIDLMNATTGGGGGGVPNIGGNIVGGTWNCQWWYRHQNTAAGSRFSSLVTFGPVQ